MTQPILGVLFGGKSNEHEVSLLSASAILPTLEREGIPRLALWMDRDGRLFLFSGGAAALKSGASLDPALLSPCDLVRGGVLLRGGGFLPLSGILPAVHGGMTEDGRLQGALDLLSIPYAGSGAEACAVSMNKNLTKTLLSAAGIPVAGGFAATVGDADGAVRRVENELGYPLFVKPARSGSSIGAGVARDRAELFLRIADAKTTDRLLLFEPLIVGREIEVGVIENDRGEPVATPPGELFYGGAEFYDYAAKYGVGAETVIPADLPAPLSDALRKTALSAFRTLGCRHYARIDFFLPDGGLFLLNEVNALPGLTDKSMFPRLCAATGIGFPALVRRLASFATEARA